MGETSLCQAIFYGDIYTVEILIARGANPLARSRDALVGLTPSGASHRNRKDTAGENEDVEEYKPYS